jgi:hypothetical protein
VAKRIVLMPDMKDNLIGGGLTGFFGLVAIAIGAYSPNIPEQVTSAMISLGVIVVILGVVVILVPLIEE